MEPHLIHRRYVTAEFMRSPLYYLPPVHQHCTDMIGSIFCCYLFQLDIHLMLVSFDEQRIPSLQRPYLCCRPTLSVRQLCQVKSSFNLNPNFYLIALHYIGFLFDSTSLYFRSVYHCFSQLVVERRFLCSILLCRPRCNLMKSKYWWWKSYTPNSILQRPQVFQSLFLVL